MPDPVVVGLPNGYGGRQKDSGKAEMQSVYKFVDKNRGRRNFSDKWICGADSVRTSNVRDHACNDMHTHAMSLLKKQRAEASGLGPAAYAPIAKAFSNLPVEERERLRVKFDIAYFVAMDKLAFMKYPKICELEVVTVFVLVPRIEMICLPGSSCTTLLRLNAETCYGRLLTLFFFLCSLMDPLIQLTLTTKFCCLCGVILMM